jgi:hypothetical protein
MEANNDDEEDEKEIDQQERIETDAISTSPNMSGMATFVAAVLRDKTMSDLIEENEKLKSKLEKHSLIKVTGYLGKPVYWEHSLTWADATTDIPFPFRENYDGLAAFHTGFYPNHPSTTHIPFDESILKIEVRIGGILVGTSDNTQIDGSYLAQSTPSNFWPYPLVSTIDDIVMLSAALTSYDNPASKTALKRFHVLIRDKEDELFRDRDMTTNEPRTKMYANDAIRIAAEHIKEELFFDEIMLVINPEVFSGSRSIL